VGTGHAVPRLRLGLREWPAGVYGVNCEHQLIHHRRAWDDRNTDHEHTGRERDDSDHGHNDAESSNAAYAAAGKHCSTQHQRDASAGEHTERERWLVDRQPDLVHLPVAGLRDVALLEHSERDEFELHVAVLGCGQDDRRGGDGRQRGWFHVCDLNPDANGERVARAGEHRAADD
jgi:hypothetical protein